MADSLASVTERLYRDFPTVTLSELLDLVCGCRDRRS